MSDQAHPPASHSAPSPSQSPGPQHGFDAVSDWVFDLDNTLYPPSMRLFDQIERRMTDYVMRLLDVDKAESDRLRKHYWQLYGTTLAGLMHDHAIDPVPFLRDVHDISFAPLSVDPDLRHAIANLPGRKIVFTNGSAPYAERVIEARGLTGLFSEIYGVEEADYHPKPSAQAFETVFGKARLNHAHAAMFEDDPRNLAVPHSMGLRTVHVAPVPVTAPHIGYHTDNLTGFLKRINGATSL